MRRLSFLFCLLLAANVFAQNRGAQNFVIDNSKPYVYLKFDHIGPRKPIRNGEDKMGLWIRVVNNCRIPIVFTGFSMPTGEIGVGLMDEVVDTEPTLQISSTPEEAKKIQQRERLRKSKHKPTGYSSETASIVRVQPGADILFGVPLNHVGNDWYLRVKFALELDKSSVSVGPFTYLSFQEWDIPKDLRPASAIGK
jgi:hypothetical protein